ncbi:hypothetical protein GcC1_105006 [Golovinomyces cichoracearum]|uniref:DNA-directed RNA polymerase III RPC4 n=1 Tax=Golovinomyces cichoracearum TaxID=62708 RepID=A0A420I9L9_9PEZI|nr:hypothetical protein GcC1_105006 [Golovinomyces cichoracearum]
MICTFKFKMPPKTSSQPNRSRGQAPLADFDSNPTADISATVHKIPNVPATNHLTENIGNSSTHSAEALGQELNVPKPTNRTRGSRGRARSSTTTPAASRFKPKNVRRSATELAELAHKEDARKIAAIAEHAREQARLARGRGKQRGRGDTMGRGRGTIGSASSIFGVTPESLRNNSGMMSVRSGGVGGGGGSVTSTRISVNNRESGKYRPDASGGTDSRGNTTYFTPQYPGEDDDVIRVDIENINLVSDDEDNLEYAKDRKILNEGRVVSRGSLRPVRLYREEHKERVTIVNTTSKPSVGLNTTSQDDNDEDEGLFVIDNRRSSSNVNQKIENITTDRKDRESSLEPKIKQEPSLDQSFNLVEPPPIITQPEISTGSILESKQSNQNSLDTSSTLNESELKGDPVLKVEPGLDKNSRQLIKQYGKKFVLQTQEDRAEYERHLEDVLILANELGGLQESNQSRYQDADGDEKMQDSNNPEEEQQDKKEGRLYLFQFPPVLPGLYNPSTEENSSSSVKIKQENNEGMQDPGMTSSIQKGKAIAKDGNTPTLMKGAVKLEAEDEELGSSSINQIKVDISKRSELVNEEGFIGKLVVRESGRVQLSWGGTNLLLGRGVDAGFLTTGVIVDSIERGPKGGGVPEGRALGMGQIMGKFVVTPDWQSMT